MKTILNGHCIDELRKLPPNHFHVCVTSPPYYGLRNYGTPPQLWEGDDHECEHEWRTVVKKKTSGTKDGSTLEGVSDPGDDNVGTRADRSSKICVKCRAWIGELGQEPAPDLYIKHLVQVFAHVYYVLRPDGILWVNIADSLAAGGHGGGGGSFSEEKKQGEKCGGPKGRKPPPCWGLKKKDKMLIPARLAIALQEWGWYVRQDNVWCLSGGTMMYAQTQSGICVGRLESLVRLDPSTVKLWNGDKWTQVLQWTQSSRTGTELEFVLRSGERISCTTTHRFPTSRGLLRADELRIGDVLQRTKLPDEGRTALHIDTDAAWLAGLFLAEGSRSEDTIQIAGHASQTDRLERVKNIVAGYGGSVTCTYDGNKQGIRIYGRVINAVITQLISGRTAKDKGLSATCWSYSDAFLRSLLDGYLSGDGHFDAANNRWRLCFTRNYNLERDLRTLAARLGFHLTLKPTFVRGFDKTWPAFKGEIRFERSGHLNQCDTTEIVEIRKARCRAVYDISVADEPHLFALASGILTHNSKPNPMRESVQDRCTTSHEYVFQLTKSEKYFSDFYAIKEPVKKDSIARVMRGCNEHKNSNGAPGQPPHSFIQPAANMTGLLSFDGISAAANKLSVWNIAVASYKGAHFATFPPELIEPCIRASTSDGGCCAKCGKPYARVLEKLAPDLLAQKAAGGNDLGLYLGKSRKNHKKAGVQDASAKKARILKGMIVRKTVGFKPLCKCGLNNPDSALSLPHHVVPCRVLDPFFGSGTTGEVALTLNRDVTGIELNPEYLPFIAERTSNGKIQPTLTI